MKSPKSEKHAKRGKRKKEKKKMLPSKINGYSVNLFVVQYDQDELLTTPYCGVFPAVCSAQKTKPFQFLLSLRRKTYYVCDFLLEQGCTLCALCRRRLSADCLPPRDYATGQREGRGQGKGNHEGAAASEGDGFVPRRCRCRCGTWRFAGDVAGGGRQSDSKDGSRTGR